MSDGADASGALDFATLRDEPFPVEVTERGLVYEGRVWDVRTETFLYNGEPTHRDFIDHTGAVAIVAIDDQQRVLLIQQYRHPLGLRDWEIPAGLLDVEGEPLVDTARRELAEEADLVAETWDTLMSVRTSPGGSNEVVHLFLATDLSAAPEVHDRVAEELDIRIEWVPIEAVVTAVLEGRMTNAMLAVGVLAAAERLRRASGDERD